MENQSASIIAKDAQIKELMEKAASVSASKKEIFYGLENGKLMRNDNGKISSTEGIALPNKTKIAADGTITREDGTKIKLVSGEWYSVTETFASASAK